MSASGFAQLPPPPYYAVIFSSQRTAGDQGYGETAQRMVDLAREQPGFLGVESARGAEGFGITVAYFESEEAIANWKKHAEHREAQRKGHSMWYEHFEVRVAGVVRAYGMPRR
jgi:heme-degrading monooxygenase HmoA